MSTLNDDDLPIGWAWSRLGSLGEYINGRGFKKSEWSNSGLPIIRIQNLTGSGSSFNYFSGELDDRHVVRYGDLLISWAATLGAHIWRGPEAALNQHIFKVRTHIDPLFLRYLIDYHLDEMVTESHGSGMVHITRTKFDNIRVAVPPLEEQRRIVETLEDHLSRLDVAETGIANSITRLPALRGAIRSTMTCSRQLEAELPPGWHWGRLADVLDRIEAGKSFRCEARPANTDEWGVIKVSAMTWGEFRPAEQKAVPAGKQVDPRHEIKVGDILVSRANTIAYVGAPVLVRECRPQLLLSDKSLRLVPKPGIDKRWLIQVLSSPIVRSQISAKATGTKDSMRNISQTDLFRIRIPIAPAPDQAVVSEEIENGISRIDKLAAEVEGARIGARMLRKSILRKAFSGRLVAQNPEEESATVLLARIRDNGAIRSRNSKQDIRKSSAKKAASGPSVRQSLASSHIQTIAKQQELPL
ncbi:restriction endonuclease subunit S [Actinoplanes hulinensis]|uniref:Restriction endonuclease subunit S n=1 Tax=Actinoplanes hulinensis TaxID=1144547 RepID=A0ABS7B0D2_9ACTN|nr:restriction endonuclease subunit S [Actinoplanes hulinensis]MBW6434501.1 restriction endonuclease subunit S [Actinoplanes hulinensis]